MNNDFDTISSAVDGLTEAGYKEDFETNGDHILAIYSKKQYQPEDLKILKSYRFEGMTDPADQAVVFAMEANDGTKGTMVISYSSQHNQDMELLKKIPYRK